MYKMILWSRRLSQEMAIPRIQASCGFLKMLVSSKHHNRSICTVNSLVSLGFRL